MYNDKEATMENTTPNVKAPTNNAELRALVTRTARLTRTFARVLYAVRAVTAKPDQTTPETERLKGMRDAAYMIASALTNIVAPMIPTGDTPNVLRTPEARKGGESLVSLYKATFASTTNATGMLDAMFAVKSLVEGGMPEAETNKRVREFLANVEAQLEAEANADAASVGLVAVPGDTDAMKN